MGNARTDNRHNTVEVLILQADELIQNVLYDRAGLEDASEFHRRMEKLRQWQKLSEELVEIIEQG
jgi:hypothetical protein